MEDLFDAVEILYTAHCCMCKATENEPMEKNDFMELLPENPGSIMKIAAKMINPKKK